MNNHGKTQYCLPGSLSRVKNGVWEVFIAGVEERIGFLSSSNMDRESTISAFHFLFHLNTAATL